MFRRTRRIVAITVITVGAAALPAASASAYTVTMSDVLVSSATVAPTAPTTASIAADLYASDAAGKPKVRIKVTLRVRPTGG